MIFKVEYDHGQMYLGLSWKTTKEKFHEAFIINLSHVTHLSNLEHAFPT